MSGQKAPRFNIAVAPDRLNEAVRSNLEKLRADDERIRCNLDRIFETERRLHSTFHRNRLCTWLRSREFATRC